MKEQMNTLNLIAQTIFDKKGFNILALDVQGVSTMTDYYVIAEGTVDRHVKSLSRELKQKLEEQGLKVLHAEGEKDGEWVVLDYGEVVIHLFIPELREKYALEELWTDGKIVDVEITISKEEKHIGSYE